MLWDFFPKMEVFTAGFDDAHQDYVYLYQVEHPLIPKWAAGNRIEVLIKSANPHRVMAMWNYNCMMGLKYRLEEVVKNDEVPGFGIWARFELIHYRDDIPKDWIVFSIDKSHGRAGELTEWLEGNIGQAILLNSFTELSIDHFLEWMDQHKHGNRN